MGFLKDFFVYIYESVYYDQAYREVFDILYGNSIICGYFWLFCIAFFIPVVCMGLFYFVWKYPFGKWYHWFIWSGITVLISGLTTRKFLYEILSIPLRDFSYGDGGGVWTVNEFTDKLIREYTLLNSLYSILIILVFTLVFKQFSTHQAHLPFVLKKTK